MYVCISIPPIHYLLFYPCTYYENTIFRNDLLRYRRHRKTASCLIIIYIYRYILPVYNNLIPTNIFTIFTLPSPIHGLRIIFYIYRIDNK